MKALTIKQPWAHLIIHAAKDVENRSWSPMNSLDIGDRIAIHAGQAIDSGACRWVRDRFPDVTWPERLTRGAILGTVKVVGWTRGSRSPWAIPGVWHWLLADPVAIVPVYCRGQQGLWTVPRNVEIPGGAA